jgi:hypothetical protein
VQPTVETTDGWIERALELTEEGTPERGQALTARAMMHPEEEHLAREASEMADRLGEPALRSWAWAARAASSFEAGRFEDSMTWAQRRFDLEDAISDPDHLVELRETAMPPAAALGRLRELRRLAHEHGQLTHRLSPHHQTHSVAMVVEAEELAGNWAEIRALEERVEQAVAANRDTPCVRNARCLLVCATALVYGGDDERSSEVEQAANAVGMEGHAGALEGARIRLALARGDLEEVGARLEQTPVFRFTFAVPTFSARLDALASVGDRDRVEEEAPPFLQRGTYFEPFAMRALGIVREDEDLIRQALERFEALRLDWHAEQTRALL